MQDITVAKRMALKFEVWIRDNFICCYCRLDMKKLYDDWKQGKISRKAAMITVDHIVPVVKGGEWKVSNLLTACSKCNLAKGASSTLPGLKRKLKMVETLWGIRERPIIIAPLKKKKHSKRNVYAPKDKIVYPKEVIVYRGGEKIIIK